MEVPADAKVGRALCPKCFEMVAAGHVCTEPDCPLEAEPESGPEAKVYPELAKANVLRMRGEYKLARDTCLSLLRQYPNNADAHTLLGDIEAEEGDLVHAAQWYEMALDLRPESEVAAQKLARLRQRIQDREARETAQQLGLPTTRPRALVFAGLAIVLVLGSIITAFVLGGRMREPGARKREVMTAPIQAAVPVADPTPKAEAESRSEVPVPPPVPTATPESPPAVAEEVTLLARLQEEIVEGSRLLAARQDPRDKSIEVTARADQANDLRELAALVGVSILDRHADSKRVTVRLSDRNALVLVADVQREIVEASREAIGDIASGHHNKDALLGVLTNVWP